MRGLVKLGSIPCPQLELDITKKMGSSLSIKILEKLKLIYFGKREYKVWNVQETETQGLIVNASDFESTFVIKAAKAIEK